ncbi:MAG: preprotein translocase subunit YajC [Elusimicrobiota bacterium]
MLWMINFAWAQAPKEAPAAAQSPLGGLLPLVLVFVIFYFLLIRPQQKKEKEHRKMLTELNKGDYVLTTGGVYGTIVGIKTDAFELKVDDNTKLLISRNAIAQVVKKQGSTN